MEFSEVFVSMLIPEVARWGGSELIKVSSGLSVGTSVPGAHSRCDGCWTQSGSETSALAAVHCAYAYKPSREVESTHSRTALQ